MPVSVSDLRRGPGPRRPVDRRRRPEDPPAGARRTLAVRAAGPGRTVRGVPCAHAGTGDTAVITMAGAPRSARPDVAGHASPRRPVGGRPAAGDGLVRRPSGMLVPTVAGFPRDRHARPTVRTVRPRTVRQVAGALEGRPPRGLIAAPATGHGRRPWIAGTPRGRGRFRSARRLMAPVDRLRGRARSRRGVAGSAPRPGPRRNGARLVGTRPIHRAILSTPHPVERSGLQLREVRTCVRL